MTKLYFTQIIYDSTKYFNKKFAQLAGAVEYTDCTSAEGKNPWPGMVAPDKALSMG